MKLVISRAMLKLVTGLLVAVVLAGCTRPTDVVIPTLSTRWNDELSPILEKLPHEDGQSLVR